MTSYVGQPHGRREEEQQEGREMITLAVHHRGEAHHFDLSSTATLEDLSEEVAHVLSIPPENQKFMLLPKPGMKKAPFPPLPLSELPLASPKFKITLLGSTTAEVSSLDNAAKEARKRHQRPRYGVVKPAKPTSRRPQQSSQYTFHTLRPLPYLPNPERSLAYMTRLRDDPGIRSAMQKHRFSIPLLTEMDPIQHTSFDSKTLGLNRNKGQAIELRLRTDEYAGYRDYRTVRKTLCHELAHCVFSEHDREFWNLTAQIEKEVERGDYWGHGQRLTDEEFYNPEDWEKAKDGHDAMDHGGWTGGQFVLGGGTPGGQPANSAHDRREVLARAAEERLARERQKGGKSSEATNGGDS
ncbi:hypothetical protein KEM55_002714 [Ascosphaera atra]|nr:hypothetical protein KEM55_002714 [Ascosphaera atra]